MVGEDKPVKSVIFVPFTPKREFRRRLSEEENLLIEYGSIKYIERSGRTIQSLVVRPDPWAGNCGQETAFYATQGTQEYAWTNGHCTRYTGCCERWRERRPITLARQRGPCRTGVGAPGQAEEEVARECPPLPPGAETSSEGLRVAIGW